MMKVLELPGYRIISGYFEGSAEVDRKSSLRMVRKGASTAIGLRVKLEAAGLQWF